ncbi:MAG: hypothetical protein PVJ82_10460, partial [Desulfobacteraceae bacterium]
AFNPEFSHHQSRAQNQKKVKNGMQLKKRQYRLSHHYKAFPVPQLIGQQFQNWLINKNIAWILLTPICITIKL